VSPVKYEMCFFIPEDGILHINEVAGSITYLQCLELIIIFRMNSANCCFTNYTLFIE
jgi:hypothetical protein